MIAARKALRRDAGHTCLRQAERAMAVSAAARFVIADAAQVDDFALFASRCEREPNARIAPLFADGPISSAAPHGPWLLGVPDALDRASWLVEIAAGLPARPVMSFASSSMTFDALCAHLKAHVFAEDDDRQSWVLAFWDPLVLAALVGSPDDETLYVKGPVLNATQRAALLAPFDAWAYVDPAGQWQVIRGANAARSEPFRPLRLSTAQMEQLAKVNWIDEMMRNLREIVPASARMPELQLRRLCLDAARRTKSDSMPDHLNAVLPDLIAATKPWKETTDAEFAR